MLSFENAADRRRHRRYYLPTVEINHYNVIIDGRNIFGQPVTNNIRKIATGQGDDYTTGCLLDYLYFKQNYKLIAITLRKQQGLDANPKAIH